MPVLGLRRHVHHVAGVELNWLLAPLLVVAAPAHGNENLTGLVMDMPVVAATRLECDVGNVDFLARDQQCQIALPNEILGVCVFPMHGRIRTTPAATPCSTNVSAESTSGEVGSARRCSVHLQLRTVKPASAMRSRMFRAIDMHRFAGCRLSCRCLPCPQR